MIDQIVEAYIALRDKKAQMDAAHKAAVAPITAAMDRAEAKLLEEMQRQGTTAFKTDAGTAYQNTRTSATVADWDSLLNHIRANDLWNLLERRVSKTAVDEFVAENSDLPPGVNYRQELTVNIRRT